MSVVKKTSAATMKGGKLSSICAAASLLIQKPNKTKKKRAIIKLEDHVI
jgi:hypothetical protein